MKKTSALLYGGVCYVVFLAVFSYAIWFVWTLDEPRAAAPWPRSLLINMGLLALFAGQHSVMARQWFKRRWTRIVVPPVERSTYVLVASVVLLLVIVGWQPMPARVWSVDNPVGRLILQGLFGAGWAIVLASTFLIDHFDLFGLKQVWTYWRGEKYQPSAFQVYGLYKWVRHPIYLGFIIAFWSTPTMSIGHLFFAAMCTGYIVIAIQLEERDLITFHGEPYRIYQSGVSMLAPWPRKKESVAVPSTREA
ncbi:MAG TPA: hypothetical protein VEC38_01630 [Candidatus Binataceae bacterium]|nr:hypothetical protein [Candidatus Binataceae bacterium]